MTVNDIFQSKMMLLSGTLVFSPGWVITQDMGTRVGFTSYESGGLELYQTAS